MLDRVERGGLDDVDHYWRGQNRDAPGADERRCVLRPDQELRGSFEAGRDAGEIDHGGSGVRSGRAYEALLGQF